VGLTALFSRLDSLAGRFNRWFGATAVAASAERMGAANGGPQIDPTAVVAALGEIKSPPDEESSSDLRQP
jgi:hypothetical protein